MSTTIVAALTTTLLESASMLGMDRSRLLTTSGLCERDFEDPDGRLPLDAHVRVWEAIAAGGPPDAGLRIGERFQPLALGAVGHAIELAPTIGDAVQTFARFLKLVLTDGVSELQISGDEVRFMLVLPPQLTRLHHPQEAAAASGITLLRKLMGRAVVPLRVGFQHPAPASTDRHRELFGICPRFGAPFNEMVFPAALLKAPNACANPPTHRYLVRRAEELAGRLADEGPVVARARRALLLELRHGEPRADAIAKRLHMSGRTLCRRLAAEGSSLAQVLDDVRREAAVLLLADPKRAIAEIASDLGYGDSSTFARAFRRWTGVSPGAYRRRAAETPVASSHPADQNPPRNVRLEHRARRGEQIHNVE